MRKYAKGAACLIPMSSAIILSLPATQSLIIGETIWVTAAEYKGHSNIFPQDALGRSRRTGSMELENPRKYGALAQISCESCRSIELEARIWLSYRDGFSHIKVDSSGCRKW
jgi:hypothetical protein